MTSPAAPLIICFGDSLTAGYQSPAFDAPYLAETPYGRFLQDRLHGKACIAVSGLCGETTGEMVARFSKEVLPRRPAWVVILGGTNDLGCQIAPHDVMENLRRMYEAALGQGSRPVAVTVPSIRIDGGPENVGSPLAETGLAGDASRWLADHIERRRKLNRLIADYCAHQSLPCVDLFADTAEPTSGQLAARYSNDGLHLTTAGYERLATLLYEQVFASLAEATASG
jgi:lysophospholipase L1-like esterase